MIPATTSNVQPIAAPRQLPLPRLPITTRPATLGDLPFIDALQKLHTNMVGWMPTKQLEGKIGAGHVLLATDNSQLATPLGYCIGHDQYFKRDDVGIIYQMNVVPGRQRGLIGATLVKAMFDRAAYGCRLFCCWCAQDIEANYFWESLGFIPLAFRAGSRDKGRVHIFWQRRIRAGDEGQGGTPYWFPSQTSSGAIREDRLVLPIPPGVHWKSAMPVLLPQVQKELPVASGQLPVKKVPTLMPPTRRGARFGPPSANPEPLPAVEKAKPEKKKRQKVKADPMHVAAARELRDRYLEQYNRTDAGAGATGGAIGGAGKYDVARALPTRSSASESDRSLPIQTNPPRLLDAA